LRAADIFCDAEQYNKGAAIYNKLLQQEPNLEFINLKLADIYRKMGFVGQAFNQYQKLYCSYHEAGRKDKASELIGRMADLDPEKFTLSEKNNMAAQEFEEGENKGAKEKVEETKGARPMEEEKRSCFDLTSMLEANRPMECGIPKLTVREEGNGVENILGELEKTGETGNSYLNHHYQMGLVCKEMGLMDEAIKQFQLALEKNQNSIETAKQLDQCLMDKRSREGGLQSSGLALPIENIEDAARVEVPYKSIPAFSNPLPQM
jgi:tetratricopeptide (TPR) repeat protein